MNRRFVGAALLVGVLASAALAQRDTTGTTASVLDLGTNQVISHFVIGLEPTAVAWRSSDTAYVLTETGNTLVRLDMTVTPPNVTATYTFPNGFAPHSLAVNAAGTRALVTGDTTSVLLLDLTTTPFPTVDTITVVAPGGVALYEDSTPKARGIIVDEDVLRVLDLSIVPATVQNVTLGSPGLAVAVNGAGSKAAVSLDMGGLQLVDLTTVPPSLIPPVVGSGMADPLGVAISPDGTRAIYVEEGAPAAEANVVDIGSMTPSVVHTVPIALASPSAVAFNPVTNAALVAADNGIAILNPPYSAVTGTITDTGLSGTTAFAIAVNPAGTKALVLNEDVLATVPTVTMLSVACGPTAGGTTVLITGTAFTGDAMVRFGNAAATGVKLDSGTHMTAVSPPGSGTVDVFVTTAAGTSAASPATKFRFDPMACVTTTTTTLPGSCDVSVATFASIDCRLDKLITQVQAATDLGKLKNTMLKSLTQARVRKLAAEGLVATKKKLAKKRLKEAIRKMITFNFRVRSLTARKTIPAPTRKSLGDQGAAIQKEMQTLLRTL